MPTTIHLPPDLLKRVDRRAEEVGVSRNRYIRRALEKAVDSETSWSRTLVDMLARAAADPDAQKDVEAMRRAVVSARRSRRRPPRL